jgi:hypothetical protein
LAEGAIQVIPPAAATLVSSPDGVTWTPHVSGAYNNLNASAASPDLFVLVGDTGTIMETYFSAVPRLLPPAPLPNGSVSLDARGAIGGAHRLQYAASLPATIWQTLFGFTNTVQDVILTDASAKTNRQRFYRLATP